jgi:hypothetical protein
MTVMAKFAAQKNRRFQTGVIFAINSFSIAAKAFAVIELLTPETIRLLAQQCHNANCLQVIDFTVEHDPEKWVPVFPRDKRQGRLRGDHAQIKR